MNRVALYTFIAAPFLFWIGEAVASNWGGIICKSDFDDEVTVYESGSWSAICSSATDKSCGIFYRGKNNLVLSIAGDHAFAILNRDDVMPDFSYAFDGNAANEMSCRYSCYLSGQAFMQFHESASTSQTITFSGPGIGADPIVVDSSGYRHALAGVRAFYNLNDL